MHYIPSGSFPDESARPRGLRSSNSISVQAVTALPVDYAALNEVNTRLSQIVREAYPVHQTYLPASTGLIPLLLDPVVGEGLWCCDDTTNEGVRALPAATGLVGEDPAYCGKNGQEGV